MPTPIGYVVYWIEHLRDGIEEGAEVFELLEPAKKLMAELANSFVARNLTIRLFELGREIPVKRSKRVVEEKVVTKEATEISIGE